MWNPPPEALKPVPLDRDWSKPDDKYGDPKTLYDMVRKSVDLWGEDTIQCTYIPSEGMERVPITRGQFHDNVQALAAGMRAAGVNEDDRVMQIVDTSPQFAMIFYAANMLGAAASAVYTNMKMKESIMGLEPLSIRQMESRTGDMYEAVVVMSKRAKQVLSNRIMAEMMISTEEVEMGVYDQVIEKNPEDYEELDKATTVAVNEFIDGDLKWEDNQDKA